MNPSFAAGLLLTLVLLPLTVWRLRLAAQVMAGAPGQSMGLLIPLPSREVQQLRCSEVLPPPIAAPATPTPLELAGAVIPAAAVPAATGIAPGLPDVTPVLAGVEKAGQVRRGVGPPCHDCHCCGVYATRIAAAYTEIDRLRLEILTRDAVGIRIAAQLQTGHRP